MAQLRETMDSNPETDNPGQGKRDKRTRRRITVYCNDDGSPDLETLTDEQRAQLGLNQTAANPASAPAEADPGFAPDMMKMLIGMMAGIEAAIVGPRMGIDIGKAAAILTPAPPMDDALATAAAKVANKYGGSMGRWADEIALASMIVVWQTAAFNQLRQIQPVPAKPADQPPTAPDVRESSVIDTKPDGTRATRPPTVRYMTPTTE